MDTNTEPQINSFAGGLNSDDDLSVVANFTPQTGINDPCLLSLPSPSLYDDIFIFLASIY